MTKLKHILVMKQYCENTSVRKHYCFETLVQDSA